MLFLLFFGPIFIKVCEKEVFRWDSSRPANLPQLDDSQETGLSLLWFFDVLSEVSKANKECSVRRTTASPSSPAGGWWSLWSLSLWAGKRVWFLSHIQLGDPILGKPVSFAALPAPRRRSVSCVRRGSLQQAVGQEPQNHWIAER